MPASATDDDDGGEMVVGKKRTNDVRAIDQGLAMKTHESPSPLALAVDLGGTHVRVGALGGDGVLVLQRREATPAAAGPTAVIERMAALVAWARQQLQSKGFAPPVALGVAAPGPLLPATGIVINAPNLPGWDHVPLADELGARSALPTFVHNDARLAALAEAALGAGRGFDPMLYLTISTGVGGGVVAGGKLMVGRRGLAGEFGHMIVRAGGPACTLGHLGCLEALASGTAIAARAKALLDDKADWGRPGARSRVFGGTDGQVDAAAVANAARAGDALARRVMGEVAIDLGTALGNLINAFDPARIVLGGGVSASWDQLELAAMKRASQVALAWAERDLSVVTAALGDHAGLAGAGLYALQRMGVVRVAIDLADR